MKYLILMAAIALSGCSYTGKFQSEHDLLREANRAEVRMDRAVAKQAAGTALIAKGVADYMAAKKDRQEALDKLSDSLLDKGDAIE